MFTAKMSFISDSQNMQSVISSVRIQLSLSTSIYLADFLSDALAQDMVGAALGTKTGCCQTSPHPITHTHTRTHGGDLLTLLLT